MILTGLSGLLAQVSFIITMCMCWKGLGNYRNVCGSLEKIREPEIERWFHSVIEKDLNSWERLLRDFKGQWKDVHDEKHLGGKPQHFSGLEL